VRGLRSAIERLHEEFKRRIKTQTRAAVRGHSCDAVLGAARLRAKSNMRKVDGWQRPSHQPHRCSQLTSQPETILHVTEIAPTLNFQPNLGRHQGDRYPLVSSSLSNSRILH